ncbi:unnamed protein product [Pleuronectes platessa]|uniref:Uncharacterized protein n=1 Tax=Pleuronectes platessa TaxID=8262 RepID=A0A9N7UXQ1_PLEPL|nr:unnamed protein product [Pleuronectes platessa]
MNLKQEKAQIARLRKAPWRESEARAALKMDWMQEQARAEIARLREKSQHMKARGENWHKLASEKKRLQDDLEEALHLAHEAIISLEQDTDKLDQLKLKEHQLASENKELQDELQGALHEIILAHQVAQHHKDTDKLDQLTLENHQLDSENKKLQYELQDALGESQLAQRYGHRDREARIRLEEEVKNAKDQNLRLYRKYLRLKDASSDAEEMMPRMESKPIRAPCQRHEEIREQKDDITSKNPATIAKRQHTVDRFKVEQSENKTRQAQPEDALKTGKYTKGCLGGAKQTHCICF